MLALLRETQSEPPKFVRNQEVREEQAAQRRELEVLKTQSKRARFADVRIGARGRATGRQW